MLLRRLAPVLTCALILAGCMTGERPSFSTEPAEQTSTGDPAIDAVLAHLTEPAEGEGPLVAEYDVLRKFGGERARVVLARDTDRWSLTIGTLRYLDVGGRRSTCDLETQTCTDGFDESRLSEVLTTTSFATHAAEVRLRRAGADATGDARGSRRRIGGVRATCAEIDVPGGVVLWCTIPQGLLALQDTADMRVDLVSVETTVETGQFSSST
jgi:hypothetical protein